MHGGVGVARVQVGEGALGTVKQTAGPFERDNGIFEGRLFGIVRHCFHFLELLAHACFDRGLEMFVVDLIEGRDVIRQITFAEQWVAGIGREHSRDLRSIKQRASKEKT